MSKLTEYLEARRAVEVEPDAPDDAFVRVGVAFAALSDAERDAAPVYAESVRWIPVEVELPPVPDEVYLVTDGERVQSAGWDPSWGDADDPKFFEPHDECRLHWTPTHWALLPKPPRKR